MNGCGVHGEAAINDKVPDSATNKLTYHDASIRSFSRMLVLRFVIALLNEPRRPELGPKESSLAQL